MVDSLSICNEHNDREILELVDSNEDRETLGVAIAPDGNMQDQFRLLLEENWQIGEFNSSQIITKRETLSSNEKYDHENIRVLSRYYSLL